GASRPVHCPICSGAADPERRGAPVRAATSRHRSRQRRASPILTRAGRDDEVGRTAWRSPMAEVVAAALTSHAPMITGKPEVSRPEQRDRLYDGFHERRRRLAAARPHLLVLLANGPLPNFPSHHLPDV